MITTAARLMRYVREDVKTQDGHDKTLKRTTAEGTALTNAGGKKWN